MAGFKGAWLQETLSPMCTVLRTWLPSLYLPLCQHRKLSPPAWLSTMGCGLCGIWGSRWAQMTPTPLGFL